MHLEMGVSKMCLTGTQLRCQPFCIVLIDLNCKTQSQQACATNMNNCSFQHKSQYSSRYSAADAEVQSVPVWCFRETSYSTVQYHQYQGITQLTITDGRHFCQNSRSEAHEQHDFPISIPHGAGL